MLTRGKFWHEKISKKILTVRKLLIAQLSSIRKNADMRKILASYMEVYRIQERQHKGFLWSYFSSLLIQDEIAEIIDCIKRLVAFIK
jgi:hypothetical protein